MGGCRDQRTGLVGQYLQVELHRVFAGLRAHGLVHLTEHEALERVGLQPDRALADLRHELARTGEQQVSGQDRDVVAPHRVRARHPAAHVRAIHDVVVVQRTEVGHLERRGARDHVVGGALAELGGQQRQHGTHPLATGLVEVTGGRVGEGVRDLQLARERLLDAVETVFDDPQQLAHARSGQHTLGQAQLRREALARGMGTGGKACSHGPSLPGHARTRTVTRAA